MRVRRGLYLTAMSVLAGNLLLVTVAISPQSSSAASGGSGVTAPVSEDTPANGLDAQPATLTEQVDLIELNHFVDDEGREVFRQLVFYDWSNLESRFHVRAWRLVKHDHQVPRQFWKPRRYECQWHDEGVCKVVRSTQFRETWAQQDPERTNRKFLPEDQRVPLFAKKNPPSSVTR